MTAKVLIRRQLTPPQLPVARKYASQSVIKKGRPFIGGYAYRRMARDGLIELADLPEEVRSVLESSGELLTLEEIEKQYIKKVLQVAGDLNQAAQTLGIDPATLWRKRKRYNL